MFILIYSIGHWKTKEKVSELLGITIEEVEELIKQDKLKTTVTKTGVKITDESLLFYLKSKQQQGF